MYYNVAGETMTVYILLLVLRDVRQAILKVPQCLFAHILK
jgi:hypothetical protein